MKQNILFRYATADKQDTGCRIQDKMIKSETTIRVRYAETDQMKVVHHSVYPNYFEIGRVELLRELGINYKDMEASGYLLPVLSLQIQYHFPAYYDDDLKLITILKETPTAKVAFEYEMYNNENKLISTATVNLAFVDAQSGRPVKPPEYFLKVIKKHF